VKRLLLGVLALAACKASSDNLPIATGGGGGGGGGGQHDAPVDMAVDGSGIAGRVCLVADPRDLAACAATGANGLVVTLGTQTATTTDDGSFAMATPTGSSLVWHVTATGLQTSVMRYTAGSAEIPAMTTTTFGTLENDTGDVIQAGEGAIFARVVRAGAPIAGATASSNPVGLSVPFYDGGNPGIWTTTATGAHGTAYMPRIAIGPADILVTPQSSVGTSFTGLVVEDQALTFVLASVP
jgi:hypothetical protein